MLIEITKEIAERLSKTEMEVVQFINNNEKNLPKLSIIDIAMETYTSPSTVSRAIKKCDISGFVDLRYRSSQKEDAKITAANEIMHQSLNEIQSIIGSVSATQILKAVDIIRQSEKLYILGRGLSEYVAEEFSMKLQLLEKDSMFIKDPNIMRIKSKKMQTNETIVAFSLNGYTPEVLESVENAKMLGAKVIVCCCNYQSPLIVGVDVALVGYSEPYTTLKEYEVRSRLPLYVISRMITEYYSAQ